MKMTTTEINIELDQVRKDLSERVPKYTDPGESPHAVLRRIEALGQAIKILQQVDSMRELLR